MRICQHCGARVPNYAGFCGECGQLVSIGEPATHERTRWTSHSISLEQAQRTFISETGNENRETISYSIADEDTGKNPALKNDEEDEEKRRRSILADFSLPLLADGIAGQGTANVPMVQGTPQIAGAPTIAGTPSFGGRPPSAGEGAAANPLVLPDPGPQIFSGSLGQGGSHFHGPPAGSPHGPHAPPIHGVHKPQPQNSGCMVWLLVIIVVVLIILGSIIGVGFTFLAPTLVLEGSATVSPGGTLHLHGGHFIPGNSVTCILDGSIPLTHSNVAFPTSGAPQMADALLLVQQGSKTEQTQETGAKTTVTVGSDGTFSVTFAVGPDWKAGQHTIRATEAFSPRSAITTFIVTGDVQPTSTATVTTTPTATGTPKATPSPTPTPNTQAKPGLNAITPNIITFGPISEGYTQPTSTQVLLNTTGTNLLNWTASWDTVQAPWLKLNVQSGQVQEPNDQAIIVSAVVGTLKAGTYNATIVFSSDGPNGQNLSLPVALTVQAGCVKATPNTLNFTTTIGTSNPATQTLTLNNCGAIGNWTATTTGGSWLLISPAGGNLNNGASQNIIVSTLLANVKSGASTYQGQIIFTNGPTQAVVNVTFTVLPLPTLGSNTTSISIQQQCTFVKAMWQCKVLILNSNQNPTTNLDWTATSSGNITIIVKPTGGTLRPGQTAPVEIDTPRVGCDIGTPLGTVTFTGPANTISVAVTC